jgi:hypothetical protein
LKRCRDLLLEKHERRLEGRSCRLPYQSIYREATVIGISPVFLASKAIKFALAEDLNPVSADR